ncbi:MAG: immunoglobulin domain-containing protein, partial [Verrucomicrobiota bacterium]
PALSWEQLGALGIGRAGTHPLRLRVKDSFGATSEGIETTLTIDRLSQTVTFDPLPEKKLGDPPFDLNASASSGLPVRFTSSNSNVAKVDGNTVTIVGEGFAEITAHQEGSSEYLPAFSVAQRLLVVGPPLVAVAWGKLTTVPVSFRMVRAIAAGYDHTIGLKADGTVLAWGANDYGQSNVPAGLSGVKAIAAGGTHSIALRSDGTVVAWGDNRSGQCNVPAGLNDVAAIAGGGSFTLALKQDGKVIGWGSDSSGQTIIPAGLSDVVAIAAGGNHSLALRNDGTVVAWGFSSWGQLSIPADLNGVVAIAGGLNHSVALKADGTVVAWGANQYGQSTVPAGLSGVIAIAAGGYHTVALKNDGTAVAWGAGRTSTGIFPNYGQSVVPSGLSRLTAIAAGYHTVALMIADLPSITKPPAARTVFVGDHLFFDVTASGTPPLTYQWRKDGTDLPGATAPHLSLGRARIDHPGAYTVVVSNGAGAITNDPPTVLQVNPAKAGTVLAWGLNDLGQTNVPPDLHGAITHVVSGGWHLAAVKDDSTITVWGNNQDGQGNVPTGLTGISALAAGSWHTLALKSDGTVTGWGANNSGQITIPGGLREVRAIAAGWQHSLALKSDGTVTAWGLNDFSQRTVPTGLSGVVAIAAGGKVSAALKSNGTVVVWGNNQDGQKNVPTGLNNVIAIDVGDWHVLALKSDGTVIGWGWNGHGQTMPPAELNSSMIDISAGWGHSMALKQEGSVVVWGNNDEGQCNVPPALSNVTSIAAGTGHSAVLILDPSINKLPTISAIADQTIDENGSTGPLEFTIQDKETPADELEITIETNNSDLVPLSNIVLLGKGSIRSVTITPVPRASGIVIVKLTVTDFDGGQAQRLFKVTVNPRLNTRPAISMIPNQIILEDRATDPIGFSISDDATSADALQVAVVSSNPALTPAGSLVLSGTGADRSLVISPPANQIGTATISVLAQDAEGATAVRSFALAVHAASPRLIRAWGWNSDGQLNIPADLTNVTAIAAGAFHVLALRNDSSLVSWGKPAVVQRLPANLREVVSVAAANNAAMALKMDGSVVAWGVGPGIPPAHTNVPPGLVGVSAITMGDSHAVALKNDGTVIAWGDNTFRQLAIPAGLSNVVAISAGHQFSIALKSDGTVTAWGDNNAGQTNVPAGLTGVIAISAGVNHALALKSDGTLVGWGSNADGQLNIPAGLTSVLAIAAGGVDSMALDSNGKVWVWGNLFGNDVPPDLLPAQAIAAGGGYYWLALTEPPVINEPPTITPIANQIVQENASSASIPFTIQDKETPAQNLNINVLSSDPALTPPDSFVVAGDGADRTLTITPAADQAGTATISIILTDEKGATAQSSFALTVHSVAPRTLVAWGSSTLNKTAIPAGLNAVTDFASGYYHTLALKNDGTLVGWGFGSAVPAGLNNVVAIAPGVSHNVALKSDGKVIQWNNQTPTELDLTGVAGIAAGNGFMVALKQDGTAEMRGSRSLQRKGIEGLVAVSIRNFTTYLLKHDGSVGAWTDEGFVPVEGVNGVVAIAAAETFGLGLKADGTIAAWGQMFAGGNWGPAFVPAGVKDVIAITAGSRHALALMRDGTVVAWGSETAGETMVPAGLAGVKAIAAGDAFSVAALPGPDLRRPIPNFTSPNPVAPGAVVAFDASTSTHDNPQRRIVRYEWDFEYDGVTFDVMAQFDQPTGASHTFARFGVFTVALRVTDDSDPPIQALSARVIQVNQGNHAPVANPGGPYLLAAERPLTLDGSASFDPDSGFGDFVAAYEWDLNGDGSFDDALGVQPTLPWLQLVALGLGQDGHYTVRLRVRDTLAVTSSIVETPLRIVTPPGNVVIEPRRLILTQGQTAQFTVNPTGAAPFEFQWFRGENELPGQTSPTLVLQNAQLNDAGLYRVTVKNLVETVPSQPAELIVEEQPRDPQLHWIQTGGGSGEDLFGIDCLAPTPSGNYFVAGQFRNSAQFGAITLQSAGGLDVFYGELSADGRWLWVKRIGSAGDDVEVKTGADLQGNLYLSGTFSDSIQLGDRTLTSRGSTDGFLAKFTPQGEVAWIWHNGGALEDGGFPFTIGSDGKVFIWGSQFGTVQYGSFSLTSNGASDCVIGCLDANGQFLWVRNLGSVRDEFGFGIAGGPEERITVTGSFAISTRFENQFLSSAGGQDSFVAQFDLEGKLLWIRSLGGTADDSAGIAAVTPTGDVFVAGGFSSSINLGSESFLEAVADGSARIYLARLSAQGDWLWARSFGESGGIVINHIAVNAGGYVHLTGNLSGQVKFGETAFISRGDSDAWIAKISPWGNFHWARQLGGAGRDRGASVALDSSGGILAGGRFTGNVDFSGTPLSSAGESDVFILRLTNQQLDRPTITEHPRSQTVNEGETVELTVTATGTEPFTYKWFKGEAPISNVDGPKLVLQNVQLTDAGSYRVEVRNAVDFALSEPVVLTVREPICTPIPEGLIAWWAGEGNANDFVGTNHGRLQAGAVFTGARVGQGFALNGISGGIELDNSASLDFDQTSSFTIGAWVNTRGPTAATIDAQIIVILNYRGTPTMQGFEIDESKGALDGRLVFRMRDANDNEAVVVSPSQLSRDVFHYVVATRRVAGGNKTLSLYIDGQLVAEAADTTVAALSSNTADFIGRAAAANGAEFNTFNGSIDEVTIFNRALSAEEIQAIYNAGSAGFCKPPP